MIPAIVTSRPVVWIGAVALVGLSTFPAQAQDAANKPALEGYCPASYLLTGKAVKGDQQFKSEYQGRVYYLANDQAKQAFDKNPEKYLPQFKGMCTTALGGSYGNRFWADPTVFEVLDGKVYLFSSERAKKAFDTNPAKYIKSGNERFVSQGDARIRDYPKRNQQTQTAKKKPTRPAMLLAGKKIPDASFTMADGETISTAQMDDSATMLMFYASWCGFCKKSLPTLNALAQSYEGKPVRFLCVSLDSLVEDGATGGRARSKQSVLDQWKQMNLSLPQAFDSLKHAKTKFQVTSFPTFVLLSGKSGNVERVYVGGRELTSGTVKSEIDTLLAGKPLKPQEVDTAPTAQRRRPALDLAGKPAPKASFTAAADGSTVELADGSSQATLAVFYASWCGFCKKAMPKLNELAAGYEAKGVRFVGVNQDTLIEEPNPANKRAKTKEQVVQQWKDLGIDFQQVLDPTRQGGASFKVRSFPTMFLIDKTGKVEKVYVGAGALNNGSLQKDIDSLLGQSGKDQPSADAGAMGS